MTREQFLEYVDHFNNHRFDKVAATSARMSPSRIPITSWARRSPA